MINIFFQIAILLFSVTIHESAHGAAAEKLGDPTARMAGRISLNPLRHLDLFTSVMLPVLLILFRSPIIFAMAKPVPINPYNFKDQKYGSAKSAVAGPLANLGVALVFGLALRLIPFSQVSQNLFWQNIFQIFGFIVFINLILAIFNLMPIPPLDGSHILFTFLPRSFNNLKIFLARYGFFILILFLLFLLPIIFPVVQFLFKLITGIAFV